MSRLTSLFCQMPDAVRPFLRYNDRPVLTLSCLDVSTWRLPEPGVVSVEYYDTIAYPKHIAVLNDDIIVSGYERTTRAHFDGNPSIHRDYHLHTDMNIRDLKTFDNKLLTFPHSHYLYLDDEFIDLKSNTGKTICIIPTGFVILSSTGTMRQNEAITGLLTFYEGKHTHIVDTPHLWKSITWVGEGNIAFAATYLLQGRAEVSLLSIDGQIIRKLSIDVHPYRYMGFSVLYDPLWQEYLISGDRQIIALSLHNDSVVERLVYEHDPPNNSYYRSVLYKHSQTYNSYSHHALVSKKGTTSRRLSIHEPEQTLRGYKYDQENNSYYLHALTWQKYGSQRMWPEYEREKTERILLVTIRNKSLLARIQMK